MIRRKDFIEAIGRPDEGFNAAMNRALLRISQEERSPKVKKTMKLSLVAAIVAAIACSGVALAIGINLFEYFGKHDQRLAQLAQQAGLEAAKPESVETATLGTTKAAFSNAYYDGESLIAAFSMENPERIEPFEPTPELLARMEKIDPRYSAVPYHENIPGIEALDAYHMAVSAGKPAGIAHYSVYPSDHCTTGEGVDLPPWMEDTDTLPDGSRLFLREFESPLPEEAQDQESLELHIKLWQMSSYHYFDGTDHYELYESRQSAGEISTIVKRTDAIFKNFAGNGEYGGSSIAAGLQVSAVHAALKLSADAAVFDDPGADCWHDALLIDENGIILRTEETAFSGNEATLSFRGSGSLPEQLTLYIGVDKEGEWSREDFIANSERIDLFPIEE